MKKSEKGIYILANDVVYDQLVALLNSIERNYSSAIPICVIPYDDRMEKVNLEIEKRDNVFIFDNKSSIEFWEDFSRKIWKLHPTAMKEWEQQGLKDINRLGMHRRFICFDESSPFDEFVYLDCDILVLNSLDFMFEKLKQSDIVTYDFQFKDVTHVFNGGEEIFKVFPKEKIEKEIFCAGMYCSRKGLFKDKEEVILKYLKEDAKILRPQCPDQTILNYMIMKLNLKNYNFALNLPKEKITGNCVVSKHFKEKDHILYDKGVRLTYLHYIGVPSKLIAEACKGKFWKRFPYKRLFMYYRFLKK